MKLEFVAPSESRIPRIVNTLLMQTLILGPLDNRFQFLTAAIDWLEGKERITRVEPLTADVVQKIYAQLVQFKSIMSTQVKTLFIPGEEISDEEYQELLKYLEDYKVWLQNQTQ